MIYILRKILTYAILLALILYVTNLYRTSWLIDFLFDQGVTLGGHFGHVNYFETFSPLVIFPLVFIKSNVLGNFSSVELLFVFLFFLISCLLGWVLSSVWFAIDALKGNSWLYVPDNFGGWNMGYSQVMFFIPFCISLLVIFGVRFIRKSN